SLAKYSLLMLQFAGMSCKYRFGYLSLTKKVKMLNQMRQSAGKSRAFSSSACTSETLSNKITTNNLSKISEHSKNHFKPINDSQFGYYLAGLIDGSGNFTNNSLIITLNLLDIQLAYYLRKRLGYGIVVENKDKNIVTLKINDKEAINKVLLLINKKLRSILKYNQITKLYLLTNDLSNILPLEFKSLKNIEEISKFQLNTTNDFDNHWLAGFTDADGHFRIKLVNVKTSKRKQVRFYYRVYQKNVDLLDQIKLHFGGTQGFLKPINLYSYSSSSFIVARKFINYFDYYHLQSSKILSYSKWRKAYLLIQDKKHLTQEGLLELSNYQTDIKMLEDARKKAF
uniref:LAGLIDADG endonuclease domain-containing protein n=1 Tax=Schizosaccharomyces osmophilus TaxID=2545709 RepID=UPI00237BB92F